MTAKVEIINGNGVVEVDIEGQVSENVSIDSANIEVLETNVGGLSTIFGASDTNFNSLADKDALFYDVATGKWINSIAYFELIKTQNFVGLPVHMETLQQWIDHIYSSGRVHGLELTDNLDGTVDIASGVAIMRAVDDPHTALYSVNIDGVSDLALTDNQTNFVYTEYDAVTPTIGVTLNPGDINLTTKVPLFIIVREGVNLSLYDVGEDSVDANASLRKRFFYTEKFTRADGGSIIYDAGTLHIGCTAGEFYFGLTSFTFDAFDTTGADTFEYYRLINGAWVETDESTVSNTQYNDISVGGSESLVNLTTNKYAVHWVYLIGSTNNPHFSVLYSQDFYNNLSSAEAATVPSKVPPSIEGLGILLGRVIVREGIAGIVLTQSVFTETFSSSLATSHNNLADLQGGAFGEYYHLTSSEYAIFQESSLSSVSNRGATGDGVTIDTDEIKLSIADAGIGGILYFPPSKTYVIDAQLTPLPGQTWNCEGSTIKRANKIATTLAANMVAGSGTRTIEVVDASSFRVGQSIGFYKTTWPGTTETDEQETGAYDVLAIDTGLNTIDISGPTIVNSYVIGDNVISSCRLISNTVDTDIKIFGLKTDGNASSYAGTFFHWINHVEIRLDGDRSRTYECKSYDALKEAFMIAGDASKNMACEVYNSGGNAVHLSGSNGLKVNALHVEGTQATAGTDHQDGAISYSIDVVDSLIADLYVDGNATSLSALGGLDSSTINARVIGLYCKNLIAGGNGIDLQGTYPADTDGLTLEAVHLDNCGNLIVASNNASQQMHGVNLIGCTVEGGEIKLINTTGAILELCKVDNTGDATLQCFNLNNNTDITLNSPIAKGGAWGIGLNASNDGVTIDGPTLKENAVRAISELSSTTGLIVSGGTIKATEGVVNSGWRGLYLTADGVIKGTTIISTAVTGTVISVDVISTFTGKLHEVTCVNPVGEESIRTAAPNTEIMNATTSKAISLTGSGTLSTTSTNNNVS